MYIEIPKFNNQPQDFAKEKFDDFDKIVEEVAKTPYSR